MNIENPLEKKVVEWLDNVVGVPTKELGLLVGDTVRHWRVNNQLNILAKTIEKCKRLRLSLKVISPKLICPLLENCSLEDDEYMQDKWANLLTNMLDSKQNIQNHVFPYLLSQLSKNEYKQLHAYFFDRPKMLEQVVEEIDDIDLQLKNKQSHEDFEIESISPR